MWPGKINNYEYLIGKEILLSKQMKIIEPVYVFFFKKSFRKTNIKNWKCSSKTNKNNQINPKYRSKINSKDFWAKESRNEWNKINETEQNLQNRW